MNISLLHIGMMKTATTYMQNTWSQDPGVCLAWNGTFSFLQTLRNGTLAGELKPDDKLDIQIDKPLEEGQQVIVSNEGFSTAFLNGPREHQQRIPDFIELASAALGELLPQLDNVLVLVREPVSWIRSMHIQSIKEGGFDSAQDFVDKNKDFLTASLNLSHIAAAYSNHFKRLHIAPFELLKEDEEAFWEWLDKRVRVSPPTVKGTEKNASLSQSDAYLLAQLNQQANALLDGLRNAEAYTIQQEKESLLNSFGGCSPWVNRRFAEFASEPQKSAVKALLKSEAPPEGFFDFQLPPDLIESIRTNFISVLKTAEGFDSRFTQEYESRLNEMLRC